MFHLLCSARSMATIIARSTEKTYLKSSPIHNEPQMIPLSQVYEPESG